MITIQSGTIELNGANIYYEMKGEGHPLVMVHGHPLDCRMWDSQFEELSKHYLVIRFDLAGYGQSGVHRNDFSLIDDINALLDYLRIEKAHLLGLSVGGMLSMDFALKYPEKVNKLILVSTGLLGWKGQSAEKQKFNEELNKANEGGNQESVIELMTKGWVAGPFRQFVDVDDNVAKHFSEMVRHTFSKERGEGKMIVPTTKTIDSVGNIKVPTLIIAPELDFPEYKEIADYIHRVVIDSEKVIIPGTAHMINMEKPVEFNKCVVDFLN